MNDTDSLCYMYIPMHMLFMYVYSNFIISRWWMSKYGFIEMWLAKYHTCELRAYNGYIWFYLFLTKILYYYGCMIFMPTVFVNT